MDDGGTPHVYGRHANWRETWRPVMAGPVDGRALFFIIPLFLYLSVKTLILMVMILFVFWMLQRRKVQPDNVLKWMRSKIIGPRRSSRGLSDMRMPVDYGFETMDDYRRAERETRAYLEQARNPSRQGKGRKKGKGAEDPSLALDIYGPGERERYPFRLYGSRMG